MSQTVVSSISSQGDANMPLTKQGFLDLWKIEIHPALRQEFLTEKRFLELWEEKIEPTFAKKIGVQFSHMFEDDFMPMLRETFATKEELKDCTDRLLTKNQFEERSMVYEKGNNARLTRIEDGLMYIREDIVALSFRLDDHIEEH